MADVEMQMEPAKKKSNTALWIILSVVLAAIVFGAGGYYLGTQKTDETTLTPTATITTTAMTSPSATVTVSANSLTGVFSLNNLRKAYISIDGNNYQLKDGKYTNSNAGYDQPSSIVLDETKITLDANNPQHVATILNVQYGGSGVSKILEVMGNKGDNPQHISDVKLNNGETANIQKLSFSSDIITVDMLVLGLDDSNSSPSASKTVSYTLTLDSKLIEK